MKKLKFSAVLLAVALISGCGNNVPIATENNDGTVASETPVTTAFETAAEEPAFEFGEMREMTTQEIVKEMGLGINLGNTMESCGDWINEDSGVSAYETAWGSIVITKEIIQGYADEGFGALRIPVAWSNLMADDYTISADYLARVDEIVGWAYESGMYVIVNEHYDSGWLHKLPDYTDKYMEKYTRIWEQVGNYFNKYGDKLILESQNEELGWDEVWNKYSGSEGEEKNASYALVNKVNQKFVDIIRSQGGNNAKRHLLISGYQTDIDRTCDPLFVMPNDPAGRCAVSVHYYTPPTFCLLEEDADWGKARAKWHPKEVSELDKYMDMLKERFVDKGIPVIIGEYGCVATANKTEFQVRRFNLMVAEEAYKRDMCPVLWDTYVKERQKGTFYNRVSCELQDREFKNGLDRIRSGESLREELLAVVDIESTE